ncbi:MAG TPA: glucose-6-phosphate isomerase [Acidimicrobiales bacterium]|nr:glucose-6-phosphate isomerase [Acidimicrobiales bacterium]
MPVNNSLRDQPAFQALVDHVKVLATVRIRELFESDPRRGERLVIEAAGLYLDYSKNRVTDETLELLLELCDQRGLVALRESMFRGERINKSEDRPVLHVALRMARTRSLEVDGQDVIPLVHEELDKMSETSMAIREGRRLGFSGRPIRNVVNIGIGGSDLGPVMAYEALRAYAMHDLTFRFISNIDASDLIDATADLDPEETLFIVASKSFTTNETIVNARAAREWITRHYHDDAAVASHFIAISNNVDAVTDFGINIGDTFGMWDWVGGRYSLCSAVGLSTMIAVGPGAFFELLEGFSEMDEHFCHAPLRENMPVILGLLTFYYSEFYGAQSTGVMPYERYLKRLPAYLQQLTMESNGKSVTVDGAQIDYSTAPVYWGEAGTNGQHSFFQLLHQGTNLVPLDLIGFVNSFYARGDHHEILSANLFAQAEALAFGRTADELRLEGTPESLIPFKVMEGNRPTNVILSERLTPKVLGALIALYEHSVFTQGAIWGINSFDQWGVEFGKELAARIIPELKDTVEPNLSHDSSTNALIRRYRFLRRHVG